MISDHIKPEDLAAWQYAAHLRGAASVEAYAQVQLDALGKLYAQEKQVDEARKNREVYELALRLSPESQAAIKAHVHALAADEKVA
jgi:hypothetical protein